MPCKVIPFKVTCNPKSCPVGSFLADRPTGHNVGGPMVTDTPQGGNVVGLIFRHSVEMEVFHCWDCGIPFAVPSHWARERFKDEDADDGEITCPNGHKFRCVWDTAQ